jgi:mono/diheme cytochrome c family protein
MNGRLLPIVFCVLPLFGCQQKMARQPSYRPLEPSAFFADGRSARPLLNGTVAASQPLADSPLLSWRLAARDGRPARAEDAAAAVGAPNPLAAVAAVAAKRAPGQVTERPPGPDDYVNEFPIEIDRAALERGRQRFNIFCAVCHDETGNGHGKIVERGFTQPPSYVTDYSRGFERRGYHVLLRKVPVGYFMEVITQGYGAMPDYSSQVPPEDRWKIAAYIKALQLSQHADLNDKDLRPARAKILEELEKQP